MHDNCANIWSLELPQALNDDDASVIGSSTLSAILFLQYVVVFRGDEKQESNTNRELWNVVVLNFALYWCIYR